MKKYIALLFILTCANLNAQGILIDPVEKTPEYVGGESALLEYLNSLDCRLLTVDEIPTSKAYIGCTISKHGDVRGVVLEKSSGSSTYDSLVVKHVRKMPNWIPIDREVYFILPIRACLQ